MTYCPALVRLLTKRVAVALNMVASALTPGLAGCPTQNAAAMASIEQRPPKPSEAFARSAYVYAFLPTMTDALLQTTSALVPVGTFMRQCVLEDEALPTGVYTRVDVLVSSVFVDLRDGPVILSLPDVGC